MVTMMTRNMTEVGQKRQKSLHCPSNMHGISVHARIVASYVCASKFVCVRACTTMFYSSVVSDIGSLTSQTWPEQVANKSVAPPLHAAN